MKYVKPSILVIFLIALSACSESPAPQIQPLKVSVEKAISENVPIYIETFGNLQASQNVDIHPRVSGEITHIYFAKASLVKSGDLIATLDTQIYEASILNDEAVIRQDEANAQLKAYMVEKNKILAEKGAIPQQQYEQMKTDFEAAYAKIEKDKASLLSDKINLSYCYIRAPINGVLGINNIDVGNYVTPTNTIFNIKDISKLFIDFALPEKDIDRLRDSFSKGAIKVFISVRDESDSYVSVEKQYEGVLSFLNNSADLETGTIPLRAEVNNPSGLLLPGQFVDVHILLGYRNDSILVPKESVKLGPEGRYLFRINNGIAEMLPVTTLRTYNKHFVLDDKSGISAGDLIVTLGIQNLYSGAKVEIVPDTTSDSPVSGK